MLTGVLAINAFAQTSRPKVFVAPMNEGFDSFVTAALVENKVPVVITTVETEAEFIITGDSVKNPSKWYDTVFGVEKDRNQGSIKLLKVADKSIAWAGSAGDKSVFFPALKSGGKTKVANRLARKLKKDYFKGT